MDKCRHDISQDCSACMQERIDALVKALADERETIIAMLVNAAKSRECFHVGGTTLTNRAGNDLFIDATRIDAVIEAIRARGCVGQTRGKS